jgi:NitT/TauT family transport system substrate-binding protein
MKRSSTVHHVLRRCAGLALGLVCLCAAGSAQAAEPVRIGLLKFSFSGPFFIAVERGYFAAEGLAPELKFFQSGQPVAVALAAGDLDFGASGLTGGFYSLAGQGALRIIAGLNRETPGFHTQGIAASNAAYKAGLTSVKDLAQHSFGVSQVGSPAHYSLVLLAEKYGFDLGATRIAALQSIPNVMSAIVGGQVDATILPVGALTPAIEHGKIRGLGWVGDEVSFQIGAVYTATKTANNKRAYVERFLRAMRRGMQDYHDAFADTQEQRRDGTSADSISALIGKYTGETPEQVKRGIAWIDARGRLDAADILRQVAWYKAQRIVKPQVDGGVIIDQGYVMRLK